MNASGGSYPVERIEFEDKQETVYNFQVEDYYRIMLVRVVYWYIMSVRQMAKAILKQ